MDVRRDDLDPNMPKLDYCLLIVILAVQTLSPYLNRPTVVYSSYSSKESFVDRGTINVLKITLFFEERLFTSSGMNAAANT